MLRTLFVRDIVLIERAELHFEPGLNVLTGETGAGKSILLDALGFVLGWRVRAGLTREGAADGEVSAEFALSEGHPARAILAEAGLEASGDLILRRRAAPDGRRQAYVNDKRVTVETLRALGAALVELHGQQDDRGLLDPGGHRALLDAYAGTGAARAAVRALWARRAALRDERDGAERAAEAARVEEDFLRHAAEELGRLDPQGGEEPALDARRRQLRAAAAIREDVARAHAALGAEGAEGAAAQALRWLDGAAGGAEGALDAVLDRLGRVLDELAHAGAEIAGILERLEGSPGELEAVEERLFAIRGLARKHHVGPDELAGLRGDFEARLAALEDSDAQIAALDRALAGVAAEYDAAAEALSAQRRAAAERLDARMKAELAPLKMERARFVTDITAGEAGPEGRDRVRFTAATNPGTPPAPIDKIASGGELSRFLLALKVCLSGGAEARTMIFDEIDRGVGGATADAVGRRLQDLGRSGQVLVVTHAPQVAARGAYHWRVGKSVAGGAARTEVVPLSSAARIEEIARMLAGDVITPQARAAAKALVAG